MRCPATDPPPFLFSPPPSSLPACPRSGLLLSPGGEFAFVLFGEAVGRGIMNAALAKELYLVVALRWVRWRGQGGCMEGEDVH